MEIVTAEEKARIEERLAELKRKRNHLSSRIAEARALGDLSENAEYHAAREDQGMNEAEIRRLEQRLAVVQVKDEGQLPVDIVFVGSVVKLRDLNSGNEDLYKVVGETSGKFDGDEIEVSLKSPMGEALLKTRVGDTIKVDLPRGPKRFEIVEIR